MKGLIFVGMVGPSSHNQEEQRFVQELSSAFNVTHYLRGAGIKGVRIHQLRSIPARLFARQRSRGVGVRVQSALIIPMRRAARRLNSHWIQRQLQRIIGNSPGHWTLWIRFPSPELVDAVHQMPGIQVIYEPIDLYSAAEDLTAEQARSLLEAEARLIRRATVVTGGMQLAERFREAEGGSNWFPFGSDRHQEASGAGVSAEVSRPRLCVVGCLDWRVDEELLVSVMDEHRDWQLILAGPRVHPWGVRLKELPNVHWLGRIPVRRVRPVIRDCDVTLIPYRLTNWTRHCLPVKVFEYLAEGKPVIATALPELDLVGEVLTIAPKDSFAEAIHVALNDNSASAQERRRQVADAFTLQDRVQRAIELIQAKPLEAVAT